MAHTGMQMRLRHRMASTPSGDEGYEDHPSYDWEDRFRPPSPESHPPPIESLVVPQELLSPYNQGWTM